jgi:Cu+-exporting ATPase
MPNDMAATTPNPTLARDPVCGMNVNPATAKHMSTSTAEKTYYFCCAGLRRQIQSESRTDI